ncbi:MAG: glycoside hydrolase family 88 protein [Paludibacteraceae bacterium]|nr:glycoside hydrolase family 88 protein [Paludibacteraceae bacterium]
MLNSFKKLKQYCEDEGFKGWDPYDGLNSKVFQALPWLKHSALCRLVMIQGFKRSPWNLRRIAMVPKEYNAKGIGLFLQGYCNLYKAVVQRPELENDLGSKEVLLGRINELAELLISLQSKGYSGACWGYNFDWQARRLFLFPRYTPTVVATNFCATALFDAYEVTKNERYKSIALSAAEFVLKDLHRAEYNGGFLFSYSPLQGNDTVFNASLLGSKLLCYCYRYTKDEGLKEAARGSVVACCNGQAVDGSWVYGMLPVQGWIDSFHTGYNLDGLIAYQENTGDRAFAENIERGFEFYIKNFFNEDGSPKYYHNQQYPIDIHCSGQLFVTLHRLGKFDEYRDLAAKVLEWTVKNMQDRRGYFYYQLKKSISSKISYMRWSNAFMFNALSYYILNDER